jgi:hypothetical protein
MSQQIEQLPQKPEIKNHMTLAVIATLFFPTGATAIYFAQKAKTLAAAGDTEKALEMANKVRFWSWLSIIVGTGFAVSTTITLVRMIPAITAWLQNYLNNMQ